MYPDCIYNGFYNIDLNKTIKKQTFDINNIQLNFLEIPELKRSTNKLYNEDLVIPELKRSENKLYFNFIPLENLTTDK